MKLQIGDMLYRYVSAIPPRVFRFEVLGVHKYKDIEQYHVKCLSCRDHIPCEILVCALEKDSFHFVSCLNNRGDDYDEDDQTYWHKYGEPFYVNRDVALIKKLEAFLVESKAELSKREKSVENQKATISKLEESIKEHKLCMKKDEKHD